MNKAFDAASMHSIRFHEPKESKNFGSVPITIPPGAGQDRFEERPAAGAAPYGTSVRMQVVVWSQFGQQSPNLLCDLSRVVIFKRS